MARKKHFICQINAESRFEIENWYLLHGTNDKTIHTHTHTGWVSGSIYVKMWMPSTINVVMKRNVSIDLKLIYRIKLHFFVIEIIEECAKKTKNCAEKRLNWKLEFIASLHHCIIAYCIRWKDYSIFFEFIYIKRSYKRSFNFQRWLSVQRSMLLELLLLMLNSVLEWFSMEFQ